MICISIILPFGEVPFLLLSSPGLAEAHADPPAPQVAGEVT